jgi:ClpP class serine protease
MSKNKVSRFLNKRVNNTPLLITQDSLDLVVGYLENRGEKDLAISSEESQRKESVITDNLAIIPIQGSLSYENTFISALCGLTSYQQLLSDVENALSLGVKTIVFDANSGGGEAFAMMSTANSIKDRVKEVGGKIITYVDGTCASACFGLAAVSDEIIMHPDSRIGSVGVVVRLVNDKESMKKDGYEASYITSAESKVPFDSNGDFKKEFLEEIQIEVNELHKEFSSHVSLHRGITTESIDATQAKVFSSKNALGIGFADKIMNHDEFFSYLEGDKEKSMSLNIFNKKEETNPMANSDLNKTLEAANADKEAALSQVATMTEALASSVTEVTTLTASLEEVKASLASLQEDNSNKELSARKASLSEVLSKDAVASVFEATKALSSEHFDSILAGYQASYKAESASEEFSELGVEAEAENIAPDMSSVMALIQSNKKTKK